MSEATESDTSGLNTAGLVVVRRLHRLVRHGYRPWLGYDVASGGDRDIHLKRRGGAAILSPDGSVTLMVPHPAQPDSAPAAIAADDPAAFDALFPPNAPNRRNLMRRLYEMGFLAS